MEKTVRINLSKINKPKKGDTGLIGWMAGIGRPHNLKGGATKIVTTESLIYPTKAKAWDSIKSDVEKLDFDKEQVIFNQTNVFSLQDVKDAIEKLV